MHRLGDENTSVLRNDKGEILINKRSRVTSREANQLSLSERNATSVTPKVREKLAQMAGPPISEESKEKIKSRLRESIRIQDENGKWYSANPKNKTDLERMIAQKKAHLPNNPDRVEVKERGCRGYDKASLPFFPNSRIPLNKLEYSLHLQEQDLNVRQMLTLYPLVNIPVQTSLLLGMLHDTFMPKYEDSLSILKHYMLALRMATTSGWAPTVKNSAMLYLSMQLAQKKLDVKDLEEYCEHCVLNEDLDRNGLIEHVINLAKKNELDHQSLSNFMECVKHVSFYRAPWNQAGIEYEEEIMATLNADRTELLNVLSDAIDALTKQYEAAEISGDEFCNKMLGLQYSFFHRALRSYEVAIMRLMGQGFIPREYYGTLVSGCEVPNFSELDPELVKKIWNNRRVLTQERNVLLKKYSAVKKKDPETGKETEEIIPVVIGGSETPTPIPNLAEWLNFVEFLDYGDKEGENLIEDLLRLTAFDKALMKEKLDKDAAIPMGEEQMVEEVIDDAMDQIKNDLVISEEGRVEEIPPTPVREEEPTTEPMLEEQVA